MGLTKAEKEQRAALEQADKKREQERREAVKAEVDALFENQRQKILPAFDTPLISGPSDPTGLAIALSKEYPTLQVMVVYESGQSVIKAAPRTFRCGFPGYQQTVEMVMFMYPDGVEGQWPSLQIVKAFAQGYNQAAKRAKDKAHDQESERDYRRYCSFLSHPFFYPHG